ncbi:MATE family efflux transporter [Cohnella fermenti]|uniref:MATE family efflux transporter n=1 Tax=Cohnella fermenti TaxID=2565925 RepID=UPI00269DE534
MSQNGIPSAGRSDPRVGRREAFLNKHLSGAAFDYRQLIALYIPILIDQAFIIGLNLLNTAMISSAGVDSVSAVNMVDSLNMFLLSLIVALSTGGTVIVAQFKGSGNTAMVPKAAAGSISTVSLFSLAVGLVMMICHNSILELLFGSASEEVMGLARTYFLGSCASYFGLAIVEAVCGALRGIGRSKASLALSLIMNLAYVLLNVLFINILKMDVAGMAIAVNIARYLGAVCAIVFLFRIDTELRVRLANLVNINIGTARKILSIGMPFAAEQMFFNGGKLLTQTFIVGMGTYAIATNAISNSIAAALQIPSSALSIALVTVVGQSIGARNVGDARKFIRSFLWLSSGFLTLMMLIALPLFHPIIDGLFHAPDAIRGDLFVIFLVNALAQIPLWSMSFILPSALRAAGDSKFTSTVSLLSMWLFRIVLGYTLGVVLDYGIVGVWLAMNLEWGVRGLVFWLRYRGEKWYRRKLV